jgi:hypothetical protein
VLAYEASAPLVDGFTRDRGRTAAAIARASKMTSDDAAFFNEAMDVPGVSTSGNAIVQPLKLSLPCK